MPPELSHLFYYVSIWINVLIWTYIQVIVYKRVHSRAFAWRSLRLCCDSIKWHFSTMSPGTFPTKAFHVLIQLFRSLTSERTCGIWHTTFYFLFCFLYVYTHISLYIIYTVLYCIVCVLFAQYIPYDMHRISVMFLCVFWLYHEFWWIRVIRLPTFFRTASLTLGQCYDCDCPSVSEVTTANMGTIRSMSTICIFICRCRHWWHRRLPPVTTKLALWHCF